MADPETRPAASDLGRSPTSFPTETGQRAERQDIDTDSQASPRQFHQRPSEGYNSAANESCRNDEQGNARSPWTRQSSSCARDGCDRGDMAATWAGKASIRGGSETVRMMLLTFSSIGIT